MGPFNQWIWMISQQPGYLQHSFVVHRKSTWQKFGEWFQGGSLYRAQYQNFYYWHHFFPITSTYAGKMRFQPPNYQKYLFHTTSTTSIGTYCRICNGNLSTYCEKNTQNERNKFGQFQYCKMQKGIINWQLLFEKWYTINSFHLQPYIY